MNKLSIKPLSVNQAWKGRRFKTESYQKYERDVLRILPGMQVPDGPLKLSIEAGFSSASSDLDNIVKPFLDCLQKKYGFDDKRITEIHLQRCAVKKGQEFISFDLGGL